MFHPLLDEQVEAVVETTVKAGSSHPSANRLNSRLGTKKVLVELRGLCGGTFLEFVSRR